MAESPPAPPRRGGGGGLGAQLQKKYGPLPLYAWAGVAVVAFLLYKHFRSSSVATAPVGATTALDTTPVTTGDNSGSGGGDTGSGSGLGAPVTPPPTTEGLEPPGITTPPPASSTPAISTSSVGTTVAAGTVTPSGQIDTGSGAGASTHYGPDAGAGGPLRGSRSASVAHGAHHRVRQAHERPRPRPKQKKKG